MIAGRTACGDPIGLHFPFALGHNTILSFHKPVRLPPGAQQHRSILRDMYGPRSTVALHPRGRIDGVSKELETTLLASQDAS